MSKKTSIIILLSLSLFLLGCSSSKSHFIHAKYGEFPASSPILDKELRGCAKQLKDNPSKIEMTKVDVAMVSIPVIMEEDVLAGVQKSADMLNAIRVAKELHLIKNKTQKARNGILECMEKKGWRAVRE